MSKEKGDHPPLDIDALVRRIEAEAHRRYPEGSEDEEAFEATETAPDRASGIGKEHHVGVGGAKAASRSRSLGLRLAQRWGGLSLWRGLKGLCRSGESRDRMGPNRSGLASRLQGLSFPEGGRRSGESRDSDPGKGDAGPDPKPAPLRDRMRQAVSRTPLLGAGLRWAKSLVTLTATRRELEAVREALTRLEQRLETDAVGAARAATQEIQRLESEVVGAAKAATQTQETTQHLATRVEEAEARVARTERALRVARADVRAHRRALARYADTAGTEVGGPSEATGVEAAQAATEVEPTDPNFRPSPKDDDVGAATAAKTANAASAAEWEAFFAAFDQACRGDEAEIAAQLETYLPDIRAVDAGREDRPVLDLGCGRGTWLEVLRADGCVAWGVDCNTALVDEARARDRDARRMDALEALRACPAASLGAVTAFHLAEHLPFERLLAVVGESARALVPGGVLIMETPNPENGYVGSHTFYHDPTHGNPLTPTLMHFLAEYQGFAEIRIRRLHPDPEGGNLAGTDPASERLNGWLGGPRDFALIAHTATASEGRDPS